MFFCTYFDKNYLTRGLSFITSLQKHEPNAVIFVGCLDRATHETLEALQLKRVRPVDIAAIEMLHPQLADLKQQRSPAEYYWTLTSMVIAFFLQKLPLGEVLFYSDADQFFYASPQMVLEEMEDASVLIHKHNFPDDQRHLEANGIYNVGLMAFRHDADGVRVLEWWKERCLEYCGDRIVVDKDGMVRYGDQKYLEYFFDVSSRVRVTTHPGVGVAPWNQNRYHIARDLDGTPTVDGVPVICYHFHSFFQPAPACAMVAHSHYGHSLSSLKTFAVPYMQQLDNMLIMVRQRMPESSSGFRPDDITSDACVIVHKDLAAAFVEAGMPDLHLLDEEYLFHPIPTLREYGDFIAPVQTDSQKLAQALAEYARWPQKPRLLNMGCGGHFHRAWLNVDIVSTHAAVVSMDLRKDWTLPEDFFDMVYHSHVLEHMSRAEGARFLARCFAVLKPGGVLRVAVPDLEGLVRGYLTTLDDVRNNASGAMHRHAWMVLELVDQMARHHSGGEMTEYFKQSPLPEQDFVLSRMGREAEGLLQNMRGQKPRTYEERNAGRVGAFRLGGEVHRWMYDAYSLRSTLERAGFTDVREVDAVSSAWAGYADFALDASRSGQVRKPDSLFMEARKPHTFS